jgi:hypothetical protein
MSYSAIETSNDEDPSKPRQISPNYSKELWMASGCRTPYSNDFVVGCPDFVKSTLLSPTKE